jgi:hypothetical protein
MLSGRHRVRSQGVGGVGVPAGGRQSFPRQADSDSRQGTLPEASFFQQEYAPVGGFSCLRKKLALRCEIGAGTTFA